MVQKPHREPRVQSSGERGEHARSNKRNLVELVQVANRCGEDGPNWWDDHRLGCSHSEHPVPESARLRRGWQRITAGGQLRPISAPRARPTIGRPYRHLAESSHWVTELT